MSERIIAPRGTHDILPDETERWQKLESSIRAVTRAFAFREIRFPTFEHTELFLRGVGETTDVVQKEMYTFEDKGGRSITLRPEGTASVVRAFVEHALHAGALPLKVYYIAPNFRYEKPQAGRLREHHQFGVECFGPSLPSADAEVIALEDALLKTLGLRDITLHLGSIGCPVCRPAYLDALRAYLATRLDALCPTCQDRLTRNPLRVLDCKNAACIEAARGAPVMLDALCDDCETHLRAVRNELGALSLPYVIDPSLVRGLDYYTRTVFEFTTDCIGAQSTVCGGGRYDNLVAQLGGPPTPALGFGSGLERLLLVMETQGVLPPSSAGCDLCLAVAGDSLTLFAAELLNDLRRLGLSAERDLMGRSLKAQMKAANRLGARAVLVLGDDERARGTGLLKDMTTGETYPCALTPDGIRDVFLTLPAPETRAETPAKGGTHE
ncbi:MAG: histidine--tRNA ligase [Oscillospiraceae bacterium]|nr:histidine--tRNA ligase [Oscillospiraceae bacterium]